MSKSNEIAIQIARREREYDDTSDAGKKQKILEESRQVAFELFAKAPKCYPEAARGAVGYPHSSSIVAGKEYRLLSLRGSGDKLIVETEPRKKKKKRHKVEGKLHNPPPEFTACWPCKYWHFWRHFWCWFTNYSHEGYNTPRRLTYGVISPSWSPLLWVMGQVLFVLRRLNLYELGKHLFPAFSGLNRTPASILDSYLFSLWLILVAVVWTHKSTNMEMANFPWWTPWVCGWWILQTLQTAVYHELWRTLRSAPIQTEKFVYSRVRNAVIAFLNIVSVTILFGLIYFSSEAFTITRQISGIESAVTPTLLQAIYFSYTVAWSVGPAGMEVVTTGFGQVIVMLQAASTLLLVGVLLSLVVGGIEPLKEAKR